MTGARNDLRRLCAGPDKVYSGSRQTPTHNFASGGGPLNFIGDEGILSLCGVRFLEGHGFQPCRKPRKMNAALAAEAMVCRPPHRFYCCLLASGAGAFSVVGASVLGAVLL